MKKLSLILSIIIVMVLMRNVVCLATTSGPEDIIRTSEVTSVVTANPTGSYTYNYTVINTSPGPQWIFTEVEVWPLIVDYEVPLNSPDSIWDISSPDLWSYEIFTYDEYIARFGESNPFGAPYILHWYAEVINDSQKAIVPIGFNERFGSDQYQDRTDGFIFSSALSPVDGPYLTSWTDEFRNIGDPPLPGGSPIGGGGTPPFDPVPEPSTMLLFSFGFLGLLGVGGIKKKVYKG